MMMMWWDQHDVLRTGLLRLGSIGEMHFVLGRLACLRAGVPPNSANDGILATKLLTITQCWLPEIVHE